jgi:cyclopropane-fatty-acyl-phospholipid synthase
LEARVMHALEAWKEGQLVVTTHRGEKRFFGPRSDDVADLHIVDGRFYRRLVTGNDIGIGESYMAGEWTSPDLPHLIASFIRNREHLAIDTQGAMSLPARFANWALHTLRRNTERGSEKNIHAHYDIGNEFYELFLDETMAYSSGIYPHPACSLEDAQRHKYDVICRKLELGPEDHLLEIGSGWGGLAIHAARSYGCRVTTLTVSKAQLEGARARIAAAGLSDRIEVRYCDYRRVEGRFDKVVSIEMLEAVGKEYWDAYFAKVDEVLAPKGKALIQVICVPDLRFASYSGASDWIRKYVFPGGRLPSLYELQRSVRRSTMLETLGVEEIGRHYAPTLRTWRERFAKNIDRLHAMGFEASFIRLWDFYLASCEASFATGWNRNIHLLVGRPESISFCQRTGA